MLTLVGEEKRLSVCMRVGRGRRQMGEKMRKKSETWINDVLEQVHKLDGLMFVSKDKAVLIDLSQA